MGAKRKTMKKDEHKKIDTLLQKWVKQERSQVSGCKDLEGPIMEKILSEEESKANSIKKTRIFQNRRLLSFPRFPAPAIAAAAAAILLFLGIGALLFISPGLIGNTPEGTHAAETSASSSSPSASPVSVSETSEKQFVEVRFVLEASGAEKVALVGDFTEWVPVPMEHDPDQNIWYLSLDLRKGETYIYNFILDNTKWVVDPNRWTRVKDDFGSESTMLQL